MKNLRKLFAVVLAIMMVLSLATVAFAEEEVDVSETTDTYTIEAPDNSHVYEIFEIFTGDLVENEEGNLILSNVAWGTNGVGGDIDAALTALTNITVKPTNPTAQQDKTKLDTIKKYVDLTSTPVATISANTEDAYDSSYEAAPGYYLIRDISTGAVEGDENVAYSSYIVMLSADIQITPKEYVPSVEKKVQDTDGYNGTASSWQDSADYGVGETVAFKLTATLPENYNEYTSYKLVFSDTFENMTNVAITRVYAVQLDGTEVDIAETDYVFATSDSGFTVTFEDLKANYTHQQIYYNCKVVVEYTAELTDSATSGTDGNDNSVKLIYSNNPYYTGDGSDVPTGETPEDTVVVFTYNLSVDKINESGNPLTGAGFELYKLNNETGEYDIIGEEVSGTDLTTFTWSGLGDGQYKLVESTTPAGYNTMEDMEFTISAAHDTEADEPTLTELTSTFGTTTLSTGTVEGDITNYSGTTLPGTGGMGTTIFYIVGAVLVMTAVVLLVTKKRMAIAE